MARRLIGEIRDKEGNNIGDTCFYIFILYLYYDVWIGAVSCLLWSFLKATEAISYVQLIDE